jgi:hypothetical protein
VCVPVAKRKFTTSGPRIHLPASTASRHSPSSKLLNQLWWPGSAVIFPGQCTGDKAAFKVDLDNAYPLISQAAAPQVTIEVSDPTSLSQMLATVLAQLRAAVIQLETKKKPKTDTAPPVVTADVAKT